MEKLMTLAALLFSTYLVSAQNVGIGTSDPQSKLHVAGNIRIDSLSGANGVVKYNTLGDLVPLANSGNPNDVLLGNGTWGSVNGTVPTGSIVATENYNDANLLSKGFTLYGNLSGFTKYVSANFTANPGTWAVTYYKGNVSKYSPPFFDSYDLIVWADTVLYLFADNSLYAYNPISDSWRFIFYNASSFRASPNSKAVWTGSEILVFGGNYTTANNNGFRYNPDSNIWTAIPTANQPSARSKFAMQLINNKLIVWGGVASDNSTYLNTGAMLDLATNSWTTMNLTNAPSGRINFTSVSTSYNSMIVWGGNNATYFENTGAIFMPATNKWTVMSTTGAPDARNGHAAAWAGTEMIVFGGKNLISGSPYLNNGGKYDPITNIWTTISTTGAPSGRTNSSAVWTGSNMLISGGITGSSLNPVGQAFASDAYLYNPSTNNWSYTGVMGVSKSGHLTFKAGNIIIAFGGGTTVLNPNSGAYIFYGGYPQGSRYFLSSVATSETKLLNGSSLYLYIKQ